MSLREKVPSYDELLAGAGAPPGAAWKVFGDGDQLGTLNFLTPARVAHAATLARQGKVIDLFHRDDYVDHLYLQGTSQLDSLRNIGHPYYGFYQGYRPEEISAETDELWALDELAADCAGERAYEFLLVCKPLNIIGGVGSPPNAIAIK